MAAAGCYSLTCAVALRRKHQIASQHAVRSFHHYAAHGRIMPRTPPQAHATATATGPPMNRPRPGGAESPDQSLSGRPRGLVDTIDVIGAAGDGGAQGPP